MSLVIYLISGVALGLEFVTTEDDERAIVVDLLIVRFLMFY